ncbi:MAG: hypothetical protein MUO82_04095 [Candidatus Thermoplasmatota archaeon]|nr:hypothetical protein [Candidatus Thermoplasmatota archaeon]
MEENKKPYIVFIKGKNGNDDIYTFNTLQQQQEFIKTIKDKAMKEDIILTM